jgi:solute:Na+ symporter, SSS family
MRVLGLHIADLIIVVLFIAAVVASGMWVSRGVKHEGDYYLGGRKLGKVLQFFLSFGNMTDTTGAAQTVGNVFRHGIGGAWLGLQTLFITPFFWFMPVWFRRVRLVTMADLFVDRFNSQWLAMAYVLFGIIVAFQSLITGGVISYKVVAALMTKSESAWTAEEKHSVELFKEYKLLQQRYGTLSSAEKARYEELESHAQRGEIANYISHVGRTPFFVGYMVLAGVYIISGGFKAAAISDAIEGSLILLFTIGLIAMGLSRVGGFAGLHDTVPAHAFDLFGTEGTSRFAWYTVLAITFTSLIQIFGMAPNMANSGSAENESAARFGMIAGAYSKRLVTVAWAICGIVALSLFGGGLSDPDNAWGFLSAALLVPGLMGLMLAAMVVGRMANVGANALTISALIVRNVYTPLVPGRSSRHYIGAGKIAILSVLAVGISLMVFFSTSKIETLYTTLVTLNAFYGAVVLLIFFWRKLTASAIGISLVAWIVLMVIVPWVLPRFEAFRRHEPFLARTHVQATERQVAATADDVAAGRADHVGQSIPKLVTLRPEPMFFESVLRVNQGDSSVLEGGGRFQVEMYLLHLIGVPTQRFTAAGLLAAQWAVDGLLPFAMLIPLSYLTARRRSRTARAARALAVAGVPAGSAKADDVSFGEAASPELSDAEREQLRVDRFYAQPPNWSNRRWR